MMTKEQLVYVKESPGRITVKDHISKLTRSAHDGRHLGSLSPVFTRMHYTTGNPTPFIVLLLSINNNNNKNAQNCNQI